MFQIKIIVDADACPVKALIERAAGRHGIEVWMVTATAMRDREDPRVKVIRIASGPDAVDEWIVEHCSEGDIVVTQDIPLADAAIRRGARVIENRGEVLGPENIGMRLAARNLSMELRDTGSFDQLGGPRPITRRDHLRFAQSLGKLLDQARKR